MRQALLILFVVLPGLVALIVCGYYLFSDLAALNSAFVKEVEAAENGEFRSVLAAQSLQQSFRINCFVNGLGVLLGTLLTAVGLGLCLPPPIRHPVQR